MPRSETLCSQSVSAIVGGHYDGAAPVAKFRVPVSKLGRQLDPVPSANVPSISTTSGTRGTRSLQAPGEHEGAHGSHGSLQRPSRPALPARIGGA